MRAYSRAVTNQTIAGRETNIPVDNAIGRQSTVLEIRISALAAACARAVSILVRHAMIRPSRRRHS